MNPKLASRTRNHENSTLKLQYTPSDAPEDEIYDKYKNDMASGETLKDEGLNVRFRASSTFYAKNPNPSTLNPKLGASSIFYAKNPRPFNLQP
jgi:hypothetical protein